jgi:hypothetical protein
MMKKSSKKTKKPKKASDLKREKDNKQKLLDKAIEDCVYRASSSKEREYFRAMIVELVKNNVIPKELLDAVPARPEDTQKTRFEQLYDMALFLAFPGYDHETLRKLLGPESEDLEDLKIWRVMLPPKFKITHVLIRATDFRQAFALGCDYACRMSLRLYRKIPVDLTIRIQFVSLRSVRRMLELRWANRMQLRRKYRLVGREFTSKELTGARMVALGSPTHPEYNIFKYAEWRDLIKILKSGNQIRISSVETETFRPTINDD